MRRQATENRREEPRQRGRDRRIVRLLSGWFSKAARPLPWRTDPRDPYPSLVSEFMLQQTQVSRVLEKFGPFLKQFGSLRALAGASEAEVLAAWSGLGYYRRARLLHACAKAAARQHGGRIPRDIEELRELPGVGRYTAGAIASIVFGDKHPIVDGNVCRVLQRLEAREGHAGGKDVVGWAWKRAEVLVGLTARGKEVAAFNEGLMELGATVCLPGTPRCDECPLAIECEARRVGAQRRIPAPKPRSPRRRVFHNCLIVRSETGELLIEKRPGKGLWASMWQAPTIETDGAALDSVGELLRELRLPLKGLKLENEKPENSVFHTTHRAVHFSVWKARMTGRIGAGRTRRWAKPAELDSLALANAHRRLLLDS